MAFKAVLASLLLVQSALGQCIGRNASPCGMAGNGVPSGYGVGIANSCGAGFAGGYGAGLANGYGAGVASSGGGLPVSSVSPIAPSGISVYSENAVEGQLHAGGNLPFLGSIGFEGVVPTAGTGATSYGCGDAVAMLSEAPVSAVATHESYAPVAVANQGYGGVSGYGLVGNNGYGHGCNGYSLGGGYAANTGACGCH